MKKRIILAGVVFGIALAAGLGYYTLKSSKRTVRWDVSPVVSDVSPVSAAAAAAADSKPVYPNSVVPGGVHSVAEAVFATDDPVVKAHYAKIDFSKLKRVVLTADVYASVSYRIGAKIFWTKKKQHIRAGEVVFTDGVHYIRGRCGNCYEETPAGPVSAAEPPEEVLDTPVATPVRIPAEAVAADASTPFVEAPRTTAVAGPIVAKASRSRKWLFGFLGIPIVAALWPDRNDPPPSPTPGLPADPVQPPPPVTPPPTTPIIPDTDPPVTPPATPETPDTPPVTPPPPPGPTPDPPTVWEPPVKPTPIPSGNPPLPYDPLPPPTWNPPDVPSYPPSTPTEPPIDLFPNEPPISVIPPGPPIDPTPDKPVVPNVTVAPEPGFFFMVAGGMAALLLAKKVRNRTK